MALPWVALAARYVGRKAIRAGAGKIAKALSKPGPIGPFNKVKPVMETVTKYKTKTGKISKAKNPSKKYGSVTENVKVGEKPTMIGRISKAGESAAKMVEGSNANARAVQVVGAAGLYQGARGAKNKVAGGSKLRRLKRRKRREGRK